VVVVVGGGPGGVAGEGNARPRHVLARRGGGKTGAGARVGVGTLVLLPVYLP
jgi:hypothetical protein